MGKSNKKKLNNKVEKPPKIEKGDEENILSTMDKDMIDNIIVTYSQNKTNTHKSLKDIQIFNLHMSYQSQTLLESTSIKLSQGQRQGLIGSNGCGKSLLLFTIGNRLIEQPENIDVYQLHREAEASNKTALEYVLTCDSTKVKLEKRLDELVDMLTDENNNVDEITEEMETITERLEDMDVNTAEQRAATILSGLSFTTFMQNKKTREFSGGWRMRISLACALFMQPTLLLLDEPTNHLDMEAVVWLESYLSKWKHCLCIISHSEDFLNNVCTQTMHMNNKRIEQYGGNYDTFRATREELLIAKKKRYEWEQNEIAHMKDQIARFGHGSAKLAKQAQSKEKTLAKMIEKGLTEKVGKEHEFKFEFLDCGYLYSPVIKLENVTFGYNYPENILQEDIDFTIALDSRIGLVGLNGVGKTTLLNLIDKTLKCDHGDITVNGKLNIARFNQHSVSQLPYDMSPMEYLLQEFNDQFENQSGKGDKIKNIRRWLGKFGISVYLQQIQIGKMSEGYKSRLIFAHMALLNPHILLLDEPTNHLDIETIDSLANAIKKFNGGLILVSHDMRLISQVVDEIWECKNKGVRKYNGTIQDYKEQLKKQKT